MSSSIAADKPLPKREQVPVELTWDLTLIYADPTDWDADFARVESSLDGITAAKDSLAQSGANVLSALQMQDEIGMLFGRLYSYASLMRSQDNADADAQGRVERIKMLVTRLSAASAWIEPELLAISPDELQRLRDS